jgi:guanyl-specific ribonuclease Sa
MMGRLLTALVFVLVSVSAFARGLALPSEIRADALPPEARQMLVLVRRGGPFHYRQDGARFGNRERLLPSQGPDYYREYTVPTPGVHDRGARRIIVGGSPPAEFFYTDDHYRSFRRIRE